jgi:RHS repeat-associated protein
MMRIASASLTRWARLAPRRRRVTREETKGSSGQWVLASETRSVYDGMRVIQERNINGVPTVAYTRGPDLSGTLEGAGGIGGLLARSEWDGSAWSRHAFYHSDGVGNVTALAVPNGNDIALAGSYRYDPFGRLIGTPTGLAAINTQRYSSKDWHNASGFYYFGYRFYDPATQRWLNRDPIGEDGGVNLYGYVINNPINQIDPLGLWGIQFGNFNIGFGNPSYVFDSEVWDQTSDSVHTGLDAIGALEPTPFADGLNGILYGLEGDWGNAGISAAGIVPYLGDTAKLGRQGARVCKIAKGNSSVWKKLKTAKGKTKTNGLKGKDKRFYEWDHTHGDIEVYDARGKHLGSMDGTTGEMTKPARYNRSIDP